MFYEDLAEDPVDEAAGIYAYLHRNLPDVVKEWLEENTQVEVNNYKWTSQNAKEIVTKWRHEVPKEIIYLIDNVCDQLYKQLGQKYTRFF